MPECRVQVSQLRVGVFIRLELNWTQHPFLFKSFKIKNQEQLDILNELGISTVVCVPEKSDCLPISVPRDPSESREGSQPGLDKSQGKVLANNLWNQKKRQIELLQKQRETFDRCEDSFKQTMARVNRVMTNLATASAEVVEEASSVVQGMVDSLLSEKDNMVHLMNTKAGKEDVFYHALNTSVLGMILGKECGLEAEAIQKVGMGLLFHDIGKLRIPKRILLKQSPLSQAELELLHLHPIYGEEIMSKAQRFPPASMKIVRNHHETVDGKGYPDKLSGDDIPIPVKIASIINAYDNHCNKHDPKTSLTPAQAMSFMFARQRAQFDQQLLALFVRCLGVYPPGSIVQLSNGCVGMVVSVNSKSSLRPGVLIFDPEVPKKEALIFDLEADPELAIVKSIHPGQLPQQIYDYLSPRTRVTHFIDNSDSQSKA
jgi:HD-GYP domain-containing protein (c-di-GMP phosphodiesterase class II)